MKGIYPTISALFALVLLFALGYGFFLFVDAMIDKLNTINSDLSKTIVGAAFAVFGAAVTLTLGKIWEQRIRIRQDIREKKVPVYEEQMATIFRILFSVKEGKDPLAQKDISEGFRGFTEKLIIWGNSKVIKAWHEFRTYPWDQSNPAEGFEKFEKFVLALRQDIGNDNRKLGKGDLLRLFINDYDQVVTRSLNRGV